MVLRASMAHSGSLPRGTRSDHPGDFAGGAWASGAAAQCSGHHSNQIGGQLYVSLNTIKTQTRELYRKLDVHSRSEAVTRAATLGLLDPPA